MFHPLDSLHHDIDIYIKNLVHGELTDMQRINNFNQIFSTTNKDSNKIFSFLEEKEREATIVPFSVFSNLFHQRFDRHRFLESTLEILQLFYISTEKCDEQYRLFPCDQYKYSVKCMRCHQCVSSTNLRIGETLLNAPSAMLRHWNILCTHGAELTVPLTSLPLLFMSAESYEASKISFKIFLDRTDDVLHYRILAATVALVNTIFLKQ